MDVRERYLDLMKKSLSFSLWPEPPAPAEHFRDDRGRLANALVSVGSALVKPMGLRLMQQPVYDEADRRDGKIWPGYAHTMIGLRRLDNLQQCVETVLTEGVQGDLIETGAWRGGSCIFMKAILAAYDDDRRTVYVADSFEGLPRPDAEKYPADLGDDLYQYDYLAVSLEQVKQNFATYGLLDDNVVFLKGWFKDTLPRAPMEKLAVMRLDGDLYGSTIEALENLYPKLERGGFCIIDDYALPTCQQAVDDFRRAHDIREDLVRVDWSGVYWRRSR